MSSVSSVVNPRCMRRNIWYWTWIRRLLWPMTVRWSHFAHRICICPVTGNTGRTVPTACPAWHWTLLRHNTTGILRSVMIRAPTWMYTVRSNLIMPMADWVWSRISTWPEVLSIWSRILPICATSVITARHNLPVFPYESDIRRAW